MSDPAPAGRRPEHRRARPRGRRANGAVPGPGVASAAAARGLATWSSGSALAVRVGTWVFGGLIAFNVVVISALLTVGPKRSRSR